jgi:hypothetical protein
MKANSKATQEPVGIVISFPRQPQTTVFSAYVWAPAPGTSEDKDQKAG